MTEEILIDIKLEGGENEKRIDQLTSSITSLTKANQQLITENKNLAKAGEDNSKQYKDNAKQIELNKQKIQENTASRKGLVQAIIAEDNSIKGLRIQNANLIKQRDQLNTSTEQGRAAIARINSQIDVNNAKIRENSSTLEKQKINIGNYSSALEGVSPGFAAFSNGIKSATTAARVFIATPLGLILSGIALALAPVISYFTSTAEGLDRVDAATARWGSRLQSIRDDINKAGKSIFEWAIGIDESTDAVDRAKKEDTAWIAILGAINPLLISTAIAQNVRAKSAGELAEALDDVADAESAFSVELKELENQQKELILQSKNRTLSEEERVEKINEALRIEQEISDKRIKFADTELKAVAKAASDRLGIKQSELQTDREFVKSILDNARQLDDKLADSLINALNKQSEAEAQSIAIREKLQNQRDALLDKQLEREQKAQEEAFKASEKAREQRIADFDSKLEQDDEEITAELEKQITIVDINKSAAEAITRYYKRSKDAQKKIDEQNLKNKEKALRDQERLQGQAIALGMQFFGRNKAAASGLTLIDTYLGAQKAFTSMLIENDPTSYGRALAAAIMATLQGLGRVAAINDVGFARGGYTGDGGKYEPAGIVHRGEVVWSQADVALAGGARKVNAMRPTARGSYATGGIVGEETRIASVNAQNQFDINQLAGLLNSVQTVLVYQDFEAKQQSILATSRRARVIG